MKLYLGSGTKRLAGYQHVDVEPNTAVNRVHDLNQLPWPWEDGAATAIVAEDLVEHLGINLIQFCDEAWRVLGAHGELFIRTPHYKSESTWIDPTHRWHLDERSFHYLDPETEWGKAYPHYTQRKWRILSLGVRGPQNIHALLTPRSKFVLFFKSQIGNRQAKIPHVSHVSLFPNTSGLRHPPAPNRGALSDADAVGVAGMSGAAHVVVFLRIRDDMVSHATFEATGCGVTIAACAALTRLVEGQSVSACLAIQPEDVVRELDGVPTDKRHCPQLAVSALRSAIEMWQAKL